MRQQDVPCTDRRTAIRRCPWAATIVNVEGGYRAFESLADAQIWRIQR